MFPVPRIAPPMTTSRLTLFGRMGSSTVASARLVSGPMVTKVRSPGKALARRIWARAACSGSTRREERGK